MQHHDLTGRRRFLTAATSALFTVPGLFAEKLTRTPAQTEGPFYPDKLPLDTDNDLLIINGDITPAVGKVTWLSGRILTSTGAPIRNAMVEIWQVDGNGVYLHKGSSNAEKRDAHFQGFGRFLTGSTGEYLFRTVKPIPYPGRTGHIHFSIRVPGQDKFVTQCYVKGEPLNEKDGVLKKITDPDERKAIIVPFMPLEKSPTGELAARFDVVLGFTPPS